MRKSSSLSTNTTVVSRQLDTTAYDTVKTVADNLIEVARVADLSGTHQASAIPPTTRKDGTPLVGGDTYFNTVSKSTWTWDISSSSWVAMGVNNTSVESITVDAAIASSGKVTLVNPYVLGRNNQLVLIQGVLQLSATNYIETNTTTIDFGTNILQVGDVVTSIVGTLTSVETLDAPVVTYTPSGTGAVITNVAAKLGETVSVKDFGAVGDGITDDTAAIQNAVNAINMGGFLTAESGKVYKISAPIVIPTRAQASQNYRNFSFGNSTIEQSVSNTPIFECVSATSTIRIGDFTAKYTVDQPSSNLNATVVQVRSANSTAEDPTYPALGVGLWDSVIENIYTENTNRPASIVSVKDEDDTVISWGNTYRKLYCFPTRRSIFISPRGNVGGQVNNYITDCVFTGWGALQSGVAFLFLNVTTETTIDKVELLHVNTGTDIVQINGSEIDFNGFRIEACTLSGFNSSFMNLSGTNNIYTIRNSTITNCNVDSSVISDTHGIRSYSSRVHVDSFSIQGSTGLAINNAPTYFFNFLFVDTSAPTVGSITYGSNLHFKGFDSALQNVYFYNSGINVGRISNAKNIVGITEVVYLLTGTMNGTSSESLINEFIDLFLDGYIVDVSFSTSVNVTSDVYPKLMVGQNPYPVLNDTPLYTMGLLIGNSTITKSRAPLLKSSTPVSSGDRLVIQFNPLAQTLDFSVHIRVLQRPLIGADI